MAEEVPAHPSVQGQLNNPYLATQTPSDEFRRDRVPTRPARFRLDTGAQSLAECGQAGQGPRGADAHDPDKRGQGMKRSLCPDGNSRTYGPAKPAAIVLRETVNVFVQDYFGWVPFPYIQSPSSH